MGVCMKEREGDVFTCKRERGCVYVYERLAATKRVRMCTKQNYSIFYKGPFPASFFFIFFSSSQI